MSIDALRWAFRLTTLPSSGCHFVIVTLADFADEEGSCFPSVEKICQRTTQGYSTVKRHISTLIDLGYLTTERRRRADGSMGTLRFFIHATPHKQADTEVSAPGLDLSPGTRARFEPSPGLDLSPLDITPTDNPHSLPSVGRRAREAKAKVVDFPTRLASDWTPSPAEIAFAEAIGLSPETIALQADRFRDYWTAQPGLKAKKTDWLATWRNWLRSDHQPIERTNHVEPTRFEKTLAASRRGADAAASFLDAGGGVFGRFDS